MHHYCHLSLAFLFGTFCIRAHAAEPPKLDRLFPPAVTTGQNPIAAEGKFPTWPVDVYCDRPDVHIACESESGKLIATVAENCAPGVAWLRMSDAQGASQLCPLIIETMPVILEQEPNAAIHQSAVIALPGTLAGRLEKNEDVDAFRVDLQQGESLHARVIANQILNSSMDAVLQITDIAGNVLAQSDDELGLDPQLVYEAKETGQIVLRLFAFPETPTGTIGLAGGPEFIYALQLVKTPCIDHYLPLFDVDHTRPAQPFGWGLLDQPLVRAAASEVSPVTLYSPGASSWQWLPPLHRPAGVTWTSVMEPATSEALAPTPLLLSGHIAQAGEVDTYRVQLTAGKKYRAQVHSRQFGFPLDSVLRLVDAQDGRELARNDDAQRNDYDATLDFTPKSDMQTELQISDLAASASPRHAYSIAVFEVQPSVALQVASDRFSVVPGSSIEVPLTIQRTDGFEDELKISAVDLPSGLSCQSVTSAGKGETAKSVKLTIQADPSTAAGHGRMRIVAVTAAAATDEPEEWHATYSLRSQLLIDSFWLTTTPAP